MKNLILYLRLYTKQKHFPPLFVPQIIVKGTKDWPRTLKYCTALVLKYRVFKH